MNRAERKAADRAEYEASIERAKRATAELKAQPGINTAVYGFTFGLPGLAVGAALDAKRRRKSTPPRPDLR